nr:MAG TPA: hypothetical protein [Caudoviricetes sp.]
METNLALEDIDFSGLNKTDKEKANYLKASEYLTNLKEEVMESPLKQMEYRLYEVFAQVLSKYSDKDLTKVYSTIDSLRYRYNLIDYLNYDTLSELSKKHLGPRGLPDSLLSIALHQVYYLYVTHYPNDLNSLMGKLIDEQSSADTSYYEKLVRDKDNRWLRVLLALIFTFKENYRYCINNFIIYYSDLKE